MVLIREQPVAVMVPLSMFMPRVGVPLTIVTGSLKVIFIGVILLPVEYAPGGMVMLLMIGAVVSTLRLAK